MSELVRESITRDHHQLRNLSPNPNPRPSRLLVRGLEVDLSSRGEDQPEDTREILSPDYSIRRRNREAGARSSRIPLRDPKSYSLTRVRSPVITVGRPVTMPRIALTRKDLGVLQWEQDSAGYRQRYRIYFSTTICRRRHTHSDHVIMCTC